jgi:uncharacterized protein YndB with AHSA1/START domain
MTGTTRKAILKRRLAAPVEEVFEACTRPDLLARWLGPNGFTACDVEADLRVGGRFAFRMTGPAGNYAAEGIYQQVVPPKRIVLTWRWTDGPPDEHPDGLPSLVTFELAADGDGTLLTLTHEGLPDQAQADSHESGWSEALEKLVRLLEERNRS